MFVFTIRLYKPRKYVGGKAEGHVSDWAKILSTPEPTKRTTSKTTPKDTTTFGLVSLRKK